MVINEVKNPEKEVMKKPTKLKKVTEVLEESEAILRSIVENSSDQIFMLDKNHKYIIVNKALANVLGKSPKDIVGKSISEVYPEETAARFSANVDNVFATGKNMFIEEKMVAQGKELDISTSLNPVQDGKGRLIAVTGIVRDITQRKNLEKQLQENERLAAIGQTAGMVGHDIRNPLQAMISDVYLVKGAVVSMPNSELKQNILESLNGIESNIGYINKIVADLQDYSRTLMLEITDVNLYELVISALKQIAIPESVKCVIEIDPSIRLRSDPTLIKRILNNLFINAIQAMLNGGKLIVSAYRSHGHLSIVVTDTGVGIPEEVKPKLFIPMMTTKAKGQGLGLAVVKRLVEELNGTIVFESKEGKGTKLISTLPLNQPSRNPL